MDSLARSGGQPPLKGADLVRLASVVAIMLVGVAIRPAVPPAESATGEVEPLIVERVPLGTGLPPDRLAPVPSADLTVLEPAGPRLRSVSTAPVRPRVVPPEDAAEEAQPVSDLVLHRPVIRLDGATPEQLAAVLADPEVSHAAAVDLGVLALRDGVELTAAVVEPASFRPLTPRVTAQAPEVWAALERGEALLSPDVAPLLGLRGGDTLRTGWRGGHPIGGTASNGAPPLADVVLPAGEEVSLRARVPAIVVAAAGQADVAALAGRLGAALGVDAAALPAGQPATATLVGDDEATVEAFGSFTFRSGSGGRIDVDPAWEAEHIVTTEVPILGKVRCHRLIIPQLRAALEHLVEQDLAHLLDPGDYGGCYVPRHIDWSADASLSMHAWGIAFDVNVATNGLGAVPQLDPRVVEAFTARGFSWGGDWRRPDGMHFELQRLLGEEELARTAGG